MKDKTASVTHLGYLDGLRALAALFVFVHHTFLLSHLDTHPLAGPLGSALSSLVFGRHAVDVFIVLSGFCLMLPVVRGDGTVRGGAWNFFVRRAWRILPPYYLAMGLSLLLIFSAISQKTGTIWDLTLPVTKQGVLSHLLLLHDAYSLNGVNQEYGINPVFWSIAIEWRIYFLFPLLVWGWRQWGPLTTTTLAIIGSCLLNALCNRLLGSSLTAYYIGLFALGMLGATFAFSPPVLPRLTKNLPWGILAACLLPLVAVLSYLFKHEMIPLPKTASLMLLDYSVGLWTMCLLVAASNGGKGKLAQALSWKPLVFLGTFAYSIYLVHLPLLQILWQYVLGPFQDRPALMFAALTGLGMPLVIGACYLFFLCCERPFIGKGKKKPVPLAVQTVLEPAP